MYSELGDKVQIWVSRFLIFKGNGVKAINFIVWPALNREIRQK